MNLKRPFIVLFACCFALASTASIANAGSEKSAQTDVINGAREGHEVLVSEKGSEDKRVRDLEEATAKRVSRSRSFGRDFGAGFNGKFIVQLRQGQNKKISKILAKTGTRLPRSQWASIRGPVFNGFTANLVTSQVKKLRKSNRTVAVTDNRPITVRDSVTDPVLHKHRLAGSPDLPLATAQATSLWNLDRIDQRNLPLNSDYSPNGTGAGSHIYVLDSGVNLWLEEFSGRAGLSGYDNTVANDAFDCDGHGTHVAGTAGSSSYGVAKGATIHSVRVLDCGGSSYPSAVINGMNWIATNLESPAVVNASVGGNSNQAVSAAADNLVTRFNTPFIAAAGNEAQDACGTSPANAEQVITVGASNIFDQEANFSNFGRCLDLLAPGESITSLGLNGSPVTYDGTSMAAPAVTGIAAIRRGLLPNDSAQAIKQHLISNGTPSVLRLYKCTNYNGVQTDCGTPNILSYVDAGGSSPNPANPAPNTPAVPAPGPTGTVPEAITKLAAVKKGKKTAVLKWKPPKADGGSPITHYETCISKSRKCKKWKKQSPLANKKGLLRKKFKSLKKKTKYIAQIRARNSLGTGVPTKFAFKIKK